MITIATPAQMMSSFIWISIGLRCQRSSDALKMAQFELLAATKIAKLLAISATEGFLYERRQGPHFGGAMGRKLCAHDRGA